VRFDDKVEEINKSGPAVNDVRDSLSTLSVNPSTLSTYKATSSTNKRTLPASPRGSPTHMTTRHQSQLKQRDTALIMIGTPDSEPGSLKEALSRDDADQWKAAIASETASLVKRGTWRVATQEEIQTQRAIPSRWVFKYKYDSDGNVSRHKARLVARGDQQNEGIDYAETFAPTARLESLRLILAHAANSSWKVEQIDVVTAFLNAKIDKFILMRLPDGQVVVLLNALYGLKQGGHLWN
jgi:hypothetical protein